MTPLLVGTSDPVQTGTIVADSSMNVEPFMLQTTYPPLCGASPVAVARVGLALVVVSLVGLLVGPVVTSLPTGIFDAAPTHTAKRCPWYIKPLHEPWANRRGLVGAGWAGWARCVTGCADCGDCYWGWCLPLGIFTTCGVSLTLLKRCGGWTRLSVA